MMLPIRSGWNTLHIGCHFLHFTPVSCFSCWLGFPAFYYSFLYAVSVVVCHPLYFTTAPCILFQLLAVCPCILLQFPVYCFHCCLAPPGFYYSFLLPMHYSNCWLSAPAFSYSFLLSVFCFSCWLSPSAFYYIFLFAV